jgi:glycosyltransferase involved in cell wall biosynthesis
VRRELGTPDGALVVIAVGRVSAQKSFGRAIDAFARAPIAGDAELWIVGGDGGEYDDVQRRANALSAPGRRVRLLGERHDVGDLLRASDVFAHSARWEGFGIVILEAMASKLPVVAFANDGVPEVVDDASGTLLVDGDIDGFARALGRYAADPFDRRAAGEAGARRVEQRFSPTVHVNRLVGLYHDVLRRPWWRLDA